jgi:cytoskeletal protein CcmA (bactofilin family)
MFSSKNKSTMVKNQEVESIAVNLIENGTQIKGEVITNGDIKIAGKLVGTLVTKGRLVISPTGIIEGDINCKNADIYGKVEGKIIITELLSLRSTSKVKGDVVTSKLSVEAGATFSGTCNMDGVGTQTAVKVESKEEPKK